MRVFDIVTSKVNGDLPRKCVGKGKSMSTIRLVSWNVNGIRAVHKKGFLDWIKTESPDMLCLQETKASQDQLPPGLTDIDGYHAYFSSAEKKGYSGVALYTKSQPDHVSFDMGIDVFDREGRTIIADYGDFVLLNVYFPNGKSSAERLKYKMEFYDAFQSLIEELRAGGKGIVFCGDVNTAHKEIDLARPKPNATISGFLPMERAWIDQLVSLGYADTFRMFNSEPGNYSYWDMISRARDRNVGWRIDYFFVDQVFQSRVQGAFILPDVMGSDHCPVGIEISVPS